MLANAIKFISTIFAVIWMIIIFSEYWRYNPNYSKAIQYFQYTDLLILFIGIGAFLTWFIKKQRAKPINYIQGWSIFLVVLFLDIITVNRLCAKVGSLNFTSSGVFSHISHIIGVTSCIFLVYVVVRVLGQLFTTLFPSKISKSNLPLIQIALGIMILTFLLFFLGLIGLLNGFVLVPISLLILALYWRHTYQIIKDTLFTPLKIPSELNTLGIFSFLFLALFLVFNFVQILRPFPIGADSLRLYVNLPSLIADYSGLVAGNQPYNWSLFMSIGLVVFGRIDVVLALSFLGGLLALFALFQLSRKWLNVNYSALVLLLFYSPPMVNFLSYMDMKIDMGMLFITLSILLLYYDWVVPRNNENGIQTKKGFGLEKATTFFKNRIPLILKQNGILVLIGLLAGFAFGIKLTVLFFFLALHCMIWFFKGNKLTFLASFFLCFAAIFILQLDAQAGLRQLHHNINVLQWSLLAIGMGLMVYLFIKQKKKVIELATYSLIIGGFFVLPILPWLGKNYSETERLSVTTLLNGKKASPNFKVKKSKDTDKNDEIIIPGIYQMPELIETKGENKNDKVKNSVSEDLHRFMGYEILPARYLSLPYDVFIKTNISNFFTDVGFVLLLVLPLLFLLPGGNRFDWKSIVANLSFICLSIFFLIIAIPSALLNQNNMSKAADGLALLDSSESTGLLSAISNSTNRTLLNIYDPINEWLLANFSSNDSVTYPLLILLFLIILSLVFIRVRNQSKVTQSFILVLLMYFFIWWLLGSGAVWYGILIFSVPYIFLLKSISSEKIEENESNRKFLNIGSLRKYAFLSISLIWVLLAFTQRAANYTPIDDERAQRIYFHKVLDYQMGNLNEQKVMDFHFPNIRQLVKPINKDKKSKVYMVGSPYKFFINKNDSRVLSDTYLDFFKQLIQQYKTKEQIIAELKAQGFKYIIFDLNMASYDVTPGKTLTRKFTQFMNVLYMNPNVELMSTDRKIKLYDSGQEIFDVFQDKGTIITSGNIGIFKIK